MKLFAFAVTMVILSVVMATGAVVFGQTSTPTAAPTTATTPTGTTSPTATRTPTPTGQVQGATIPSGAPATGMGGN